MIKRQIVLPQNLAAGQLLEFFLISAVTSLLGVRFYLHIAGYPQVGGETLHIAHMLWGGLLMLVAQVLCLAYLGRRVLAVAAVVGGLGFGIFIDELGKFITKDNNYFFQPTIALLYIIFISLFFVFRFIDQQRQHSPQEYGLNALQVLEEGVLDEMDREERRLLLEYLAKSDQKLPLIQKLTEAAEMIVAKPVHGLRWYSRWRLELERGATRLLAQPWFSAALSLYFTIRALISLAEVLLLAILSMQFSGYWAAIFPSDGSPAAWGHLLSSIITSGLLIMGVLRLRTNRKEALRLFQRSVLISILLTQVFAFYQEQLGAIFLLLGNVLLLTALNYLIEKEQLLADR